MSTNVLADYASYIEQNVAPNTAVTYDNAYDGDYPVISAILSSPVGARDGYTYTSWAFLAADATGSLDIFNSSSKGPFASGYTPVVGNTIQVSGTYSPFDGIPEVESVSAITTEGTATAPAPIATTVSAINLSYSQYTADNNLAGDPSVAGQYLQLTGTIGAGGTTFATHANLTTTVTDGSGTMVLYFWASSYSTIGAMGGMVIPTGTVTMDGFVDFFTGTSSSGTTGEAEFVPTSIVPEPSMMSLCGLGGAVSFLAMKYRGRKKA